MHLEYNMELNKISKSTSYDVLKWNESLSLGEQAWNYLNEMQTELSAWFGLIVVIS